MKKLLSIILVSILIASFTITDCFAGNKPIVLKAMRFSPDNDKLITPHYQKLINLINDRAKGELVIKHFGGPEAIKGFDQFGALKRGIFDFGVQNESYYGKQITNLPITHLSKASPETERVNGYLDLRTEVLGKNGVRYLGRAWGYGLGYCIYTNKNAQSPRTDFKGQKLRISPAYKPLCLAIGASPVVLPFPEIYTAMERGVIDGFIIASSMALDFSWNEVTKYFTDPPVYNVNLEVLMNLKSWNKLPDHLKTLITKAMADFERDSKQESQDYVNSYTKKMIAAGMVPLKWSDEDKKWFQETAFSASWEDVKKELKPQDLYPKLIEIMRK